MRVLADKNTTLSKRIIKQKTALTTMSELIRSDREERRTIYGALSSELQQSLEKNARQRVVLATLSRSDLRLSRRKTTNTSSTPIRSGPVDRYLILRERHILATLSACQCRYICSLRTCALNDLELTDKEVDKVRFPNDLRNPKLCVDNTLFERFEC